MIMTLKGSSKEIRELESREGWRAELTDGGHVRFIHESGESFTTSSTPSDPRSVKNTLADMKRIEAKHNKRGDGSPYTIWHILKSSPHKWWDVNSVADKAGCHPEAARSSLNKLAKQSMAFKDDSSRPILYKVRGSEEPTKTHKTKKEGRKRLTRFEQQRLEDNIVVTIRRLGGEHRAVSVRTVRDHIKNKDGEDLGQSLYDTLGRLEKRGVLARAGRGKYYLVPESPNGSTAAPQPDVEEQESQPGPEEVGYTEQEPPPAEDTGEQVVEVDPSTFSEPPAQPEIELQPRKPEAPTPLKSGDIMEVVAVGKEEGRIILVDHNGAAWYAQRL